MISGAHDVHLLACVACADRNRRRAQSMACSGKRPHRRLAISRPSTANDNSRGSPKKQQRFRLASTGFPAIQLRSALAADRDGRGERLNFRLPIEVQSSFRVIGLNRYDTAGFQLIFGSPQFDCSSGSVDSTESTV